jgi:hypothetical protein
MIKTYNQIENGLEYFVIEYSLDDNNENIITKIQQEHEYNKCIIDGIGIFYNRYELFHNEFGPSIIFSGYNGGYHLNGKHITEKRFNRYLKLKKINGLQ